MKKLCFLALMAIPFITVGQSYRKVFLATDLGVPIGNNSGIASISLEPGYRINDKMSTALRIEHSGLISMNGGSNPFLASIGLSYQYYLPFKSRIFIGGGLAIFNPSNSFFLSNTDTKNERNRLGFFPRLGVDIGHFRLIAEYNFVGNMTDYIVSYGGAPVPIGQFESVNKNYFNIKFGFFIGGGKK